ncbi:MAG: phosphopantetheine-binding protein [Sphingomonadaceae bacterium]
MMATAPILHASTLEKVKAILAEALLLSSADAAALTSDTRLFGHLPELDSMSVATVLTALEDGFGIIIDDEDVTAELFATVGSIAAHVEACLANRRAA